ncbi:MAG: low specificity L-threonine aldolase [Arenicella sp.]|nr:low specificity L-threonine aldolase [Arenicella sp.]
MTGFLSDNVSGIHPEIMDALRKENSGYRKPYGNDEQSARLDVAFSELFDTEVVVLPCATGTAANSLALSLMAGPINSICVHEKSHVYIDECNAPEFFCGGARLSPLPGANGKIAETSLAKVIGVIGDVHAPQPSAISITQTTEVGTVYSIAEIEAISGFARSHDFKVHMDGARFANAVATLDCHPADLTWRAGIDALSFGATKNGCMAAEAVVLFDKTLIETAHHRQKRAGQLLSKQRFLATQLLAYLHDDLWLRNARHANHKISELAEMLGSIEGVELPVQIESNMIFAKFTAGQNAKLEKAGLAGYLFDSGEMRICCSWATTDDDIQQFVRCIKDDHT